MCSFPSFFLVFFARFLPFLLSLRPRSFSLLLSTKLIKGNLVAAVHNVRSQLCRFVVNRNDADMALALWRLSVNRPALRFLYFMFRLPWSGHTDAKVHVDHKFHSDNTCSFLTSSSFGRTTNYLLIPLPHFPQPCLSRCLLVGTTRRLICS